MNLLERLKNLYTLSEYKPTESGSLVPSKESETKPEKKLATIIQMRNPLDDFPKEEEL